MSARSSILTALLSLGLAGCAPAGDESGEHDAHAGHGH